LEREVLKTIKYFSFFDYPPSFEEIYAFLEKKAKKKKVKETLESLERQKKIKKQKDLNNLIRYMLHLKHKNTVGEYNIKRLQVESRDLRILRYNQKYFFSQEKLQNWRLKLYLRLLSFFPQIKLVAFSGSLAMMNVDKDDDIDLFIITEKNRLFTGRFIAIILAKILSIHRSYNNRSKLNVKDYTNKVCLNLFFDESDLTVPDFKNNEYVAHEILQMKPVIDKDGVYQKFLAANSWVFKIFPNAKETLSKKDKLLRIKRKKSVNTCCLIRNTFFDKIEASLKVFQLYLINRHRTTEIITNTQLWFHPDDFYNKIKRVMKYKEE